MNNGLSNNELGFITLAIILIIAALLVVQPPLWVSLIVLCILLLASISVFLSELNGDDGNE